jgi:hypothetical protein
MLVANGQLVYLHSTLPSLTPHTSQHAWLQILHPDTLPQTTAWKVNLAASSDSTGTGDARGKKKSASKGGPVRLIDALSKAGVLIGAKLDLGLSHFEAADIGTGKASSKEQHAGQGLDQLRDRCLAAKDQGATFSKYRAVFHVEAAAAEGPSLAVGLPTSHAVERNAQDLAEYAAVSQGCGLVPMVEPEVLCGEMDMRVPPGECQQLRVTCRLLSAKCPSSSAQCHTGSSLVPWCSVSIIS